MRGLFKLNRSRRLTSKIIEYAVYALNFINNTVHHLIKYCIRNLSRLRSHEVNGLNGAERHCIIVCSEVSHYTYASHICKGCKVLVRHPGRIFSVFFFVVGGCIVDFFTVDVVCILYDAYFFLGDFTDDTDSKSRAREWLTEYEVFRDAEFQTGFSYFIFEEVAQRLDDFFEIYVVRQSSDVMMGFDDGGFSADAALYNVWVDGSLYQEVYSTNFLCFFFEDADELFADDFTFSLRLLYAF